jgi:D-amino-acid dehydrogenase
MPADGKMAVSSTLTGLRLAGQVELAKPTTPPDWRRARIQLAHARRMFPQLADLMDTGPHDLWMGHRPSTPDSLPVIGRSNNCSEIIHAFGHGHTGMVMAPGTASLVSDLVAGSTPKLDLKPYSPQRFGIAG